MASIKTTLPALSKILGMSESTIYERQRALVRIGALKPLPGRGRGSGVELNTRNLATLLIGCGAFMSLSDLDERVHQYIRAPAEKPCIMTGCRTLRDAIEATIEGKFVGEHPHVEGIVCFNLQASGADILWAGELKMNGLPGRPIISSFGRAHELPGRGPGIDFRSYLSVEVIESLRNLLIEAGGGE